MKFVILLAIGLVVVALGGCGSPQPVVPVAALPTPLPPAPTEAPHVALIVVPPSTPVPAQARSGGTGQSGAAQQAGAQQIARVEGANVANGARLYAAGCAGCHGLTGEGGTASNLHRNAFIDRSDDKVLGNVILNGLPNTKMPAWLGKLTNTEVADLVALLRSWQASSLSSSRTAGGNPANGARLFAAGCGTCHGQQGEGGSASIMRRNDFIKTNSDQVLRDVILKGIPSVGMPAWQEKLTEDDILDVIALLRRWQVSGLTPGQGDLTNGAIQYDKAGCASCHGAGGKGGSASSLWNNDFVRLNDDASLRKVLLEGLPNVGMPAWLGKETEADVQDLIALLRNWQGPAPAAAAPQPAAGATAGDASKGQATYSAQCAVCHGARGQGGLGPALAGIKTEDAKLQTQIERGVPGTAMPAFGGKLNAEQVRDLIAYMRLGLGK